MAMPSSLTSTSDMFGCQDRILRCPLGPDKVVPTRGFAETLFEGLKRSAERPALVDVSEDRNITFEEFLHDVELIARHLVTDIGVKSGDVVAIFAPNSIEWMQLASAILRTGAVLAAVNHLLTPDELRYQLSLCGANVLYTVQPLASVAQEAATGSSIQTIIINELSPEKCDGPADVTLVNWSQLLSNDTTAGIELSQISLPDPSTLGIRPRDPAMILFSSGTTGPQKAVVLSHRNILSQMEISCDKRIKKIRNNEIMFAPFAHIKGCLFTLYNLAFGYTTYIMSRFNLSTYLSLVAANKLDCLSIVPAIAVQLAKSPEIKKHDFSHVKEIVCGTAPLRHEVEELLRERFPGVLLRQAYGLTETASIVTSVPDELDEDFARTKTASVGVPLYNVQIKITDLATGEALGPNEEGEICIKSPTVMVGYAGNVKATAEAIDRNGWLHTGDVGRYDDDKFLWIVDRIKELIKYKSYQVAPAELEAILLSHPAVADAGVVGMPDVMAGELPTAMVVRHANSTEAIGEKELLNYVSERVAPHKLLRGGIRFVEVIPRSPTGKILRRQMRDLLTKSRL